MKALLTLKNNLVIDAKEPPLDTQNSLEVLFITECNEYGVTPQRENFDMGYIELEDGTTLCMVSI